jgi:hypothetical protein
MWLTATPATQLLFVLPGPYLTDRSQSLCAGHGRGRRPALGSQALTPCVMHIQRFGHQTAMHPWNGQCACLWCRRTRRGLAAQPQQAAGVDQRRSNRQGSARVCIVPLNSSSPAHLHMASMPSLGRWLWSWSRLGACGTVAASRHAGGSESDDDTPLAAR